LSMADEDGVEEMNGKTEELAKKNNQISERNFQNLWIEGRFSRVLDSAKDTPSKTGYILEITEYEALDQELDQLNSCLDKLESWNDSLHSRMKDLLESMQMSRDHTKGQTNQSEKEKV